MFASAERNAHISDDLKSAYLDLVKRSLTDTLNAPEPQVDSGKFATFIVRFTKHYIQGRAVTMLPLARLDNIQQCMEAVLRDGVAGDFIETGVWRGGATMFMRAVLKAHGVQNRTVWVADSFAGLPQPDPEKYPKEASAHAGKMMTEVFKHFEVTLDDVKANFARYGLLDDHIRFIKGWFNDTLPAAPIQRLALMRLDGDYYESTMQPLVALYRKLSPGGFVIVDDYGEDLWTYCREAVDTFRRENHITSPMIRVDSKCYYWRKE
jgi:hypothetical protein